MQPFVSVAAVREGAVRDANDVFDTSSAQDYSAGQAVAYFRVNRTVQAIGLAGFHVSDEEG